MIKGQQDYKKLVDTLDKILKDYQTNHDNDQEEKGELNPFFFSSNFF